MERIDALFSPYKHARAVHVFSEEDMMEDQLAGITVEIFHKS
jgi:hypothetical protein